MQACPRGRQTHATPDPTGPMPRETLPPLYAALALAVIAVWGTNFVIMKYALGHLPPLTLAALRFTFAALPAVFLCKRPAGWGNLAAYGLSIGVGQFGCIYVAMNGHISPGLASLVIQVQAFFTIGLAMAVTGERVKGFQVVALALAAAGLGWLMVHANGEVTPAGLGLTLAAALGWAGGNIIARRAGQVNMVAYVVWSSLFAAPTLLALALWQEGPAAIVAGIRGADAGTWAAVLWQSLGNSLFGYAAWAWLLARHPAATISPLSLLVPVFGMGASALVLHEGLQPWKLTAAALVLSGLALNTLWPAWRRRSATVAPTPAAPR
jgi:O-acetylserine/cysteine efflux transporter